MSSATQVLSVTLPASTLYVSGTVNDVAVTWTNTEGNTWEAVADRSSDDVYRVSLTIIDSSGQSAQSEITLYYGVLNLITDRTASDVAAKTDKGSYNASDLNRVGAAVEYVGNRLLSCGYAVPVAPKRDWTAEDTPSASQMQRYLADVAALRAALAVLETTPEVPPDMVKLTYAEANSIEQILKDLDRLLTNMAAAWLCSGDVYSGEV